MSSSESFEDEPSGRRGVVKPSVGTLSVGHWFLARAGITNLLFSFLPKVPKFATPLPPSRPTGGPLSPLSPLSPTGKALGAFNLQASELKVSLFFFPFFFLLFLSFPPSDSSSQGVDTNSSGEVEIDGIPEESWDIAYRDLEIERELAEGTFGRVYLGTYFGTR